MATSWSYSSKYVPITGMEIQLNIFSDARLQISPFSVAMKQQSINSHRLLLQRVQPLHSDFLQQFLLFFPLCHSLALTQRFLHCSNFLFGDLDVVCIMGQQFICNFTDSVHFLHISLDKHPPCLLLIFSCLSHLAKQMQFGLSCLCCFLHWYNGTTLRQEAHSTLNNSA